MNEDVEILKGVRKRLGWDQAHMAHELGLNRSYLSQLENGARPIQPWVIERVTSIEAGAGKAMMALSEAVRGYGGLPPSAAALARSCVEHLAQFLEKAGADIVRLSWTVDELHRRFPLTKWDKENRAMMPAPMAEPEMEDQGGGMVRRDPAVENAARKALGTAPAPTDPAARKK